ncbi:MAG: hypothetical protein ACRDRN_10325 [Sciscionella sp.]
MADPASDQRERTDRYAQQLLAIEQAAVAAASLPLIATLAMLRRQATGALLLARTAADERRAAVRLAGELEAYVEPLLTPGRLLQAVVPSTQRAVDLAEVFTLGPANPFVPVAARPVVDRQVRAAVVSAERNALIQIRRAGSALRLAASPMDVFSALHLADLAVGSVATGAEFAVNTAANTVPVRLATRLGQKLVWVAERDACVVCLALSGDVIDPNQGEAFDEFATFDTRPPPPVWPPGMPLLRPPRHPHCRCMVQVWNGALVGGFYSWPTRLKHEALRSVLKGWSLPSESNAARLRAVQRILRDGQAGEMPKSVQAEGERALARRKFRSRSVPRYRPAGRTSVR